MKDLNKIKLNYQDASLLIDLIKTEIEKIGKKVVVSGFDSSFRKITVQDSADEGIRAKIADILNCKEIEACRNKTLWQTILSKVSDSNCIITLIFTNSLNINSSISESDNTINLVEIHGSEKLRMPSKPSKFSNHYLSTQDIPLSKDKQ